MSDLHIYRCTMRNHVVVSTEAPRITSGERPVCDDCWLVVEAHN